MSTFNIPLMVCKESNAVACKFWWGGVEDKKRDYAFKNWRSISTPKEIGGLGFRLFIDINLTLLAKIGWKLAKGVKGLALDIFKAKYLRGKFFWSYKLKKGTFYTWQSIVGAKMALTLYACFKLWDRKNINP